MPARFHVRSGVGRTHGVAATAQALSAKGFRGELVPAEAELAQREG